MTSQKIVAIIQARMGSTRLPRKALLPIAGIPVIMHVIHRVQACRYLDELVVATTRQTKDRELTRVCFQHGIPVFAGSVGDVLDRYYQCAKKYNASHVVRITGDCPLIDPFVIDKVIRHYVSHSFDYVTNCMPPTYPDGLDVEIFSFNALAYAWKHAQLPSEREHVTPFIKKHADLFKLSNVKNNINYSRLRWTLDNREDYDFFQRLFSLFPNHIAPLRMYDIIRTVKKYPELMKINAHIERNEGYLKSLKED